MGIAVLWLKYKLNYTQVRTFVLRSFGIRRNYIYKIIIAKNEGVVNGLYYSKILL